MAAERLDVSVVVPTHDRAELALRAVRSALAQSAPPAEIVVVDDASGDGTSERLERELSCSSPPVLTLRLEEHGGVSAARNRGVQAASSEWIAFLDSDDVWRPQKLERQWAALQQAGAQGRDYSICHCDETWIRRGNQVLKREVHRKLGGDLFAASLERCMISPSSVLMRRHLLESAGLFDESLPACEDYDLWLRVTCRHPVLLVDEELVVRYGGHDDQLSSRYPLMDRFRIAALEKLLASSMLQSEQRQLAETELARKLGIVLRGAERRGRAELAEELRAKLQRLGGAGS